MLITSAKASKMIKDLNDQIRQLQEIDRKSSVFLCAMGEDPETVRPEYDFIKISDEINKLQFKVRKLKHALNVFNTTTPLTKFPMTIDEALVFMPQLTADKARLEKMVARLPKERREDRYGVNIVDYEYANYDIDEAKQVLDETRKMLSDLQLDLNDINTSVQFEVDI